MNHLMIDIETLSTQPDARIISIGAVFFNPESSELGETFHQHIKLDDSEYQPHISASTVKWWLQQDPDAQKNVISGTSPAPVVLFKFKNWILNYREDDELKVWANSPSFDLVILNSAFNHFGMEKPWSYYLERDLRTLKELSAHLPNKPSVERKAGIKHTALDDAQYQASQILAIYEQMELICI